MDSGSSRSPEPPPDPGRREETWETWEGTFPRPHFLPKGQPQGHARRPKQGLCGARGTVSGMQRWCGCGKALWTKQQDSSPGMPPSPGLHSAWQLDVRAWAGPTWSFPHSLPLSPPSSSPSPRGATPSGQLGTQEIKPSSVQKAPKSRGVAPRKEAEGRCLFPSRARSKGQAWAGWHLGSLGSSQISVRASAGTKPRFLPLLTRMKPSASLLLPTPTQI